MGISCSLYDQLELAAMRGQLLRLTFSSIESGESHIEGKVKNLYVRNGQEYVLMDNEKELLLDELVSIEAM